MSNISNTPERKYTEAQEQRFTEVAEANGGLIDGALAEALADEMGKDVRSIRAKASRMGIYKAKERQSVNGGKVESKLDIAEEIARIVGRNMEGMEKAPKTQLQNIRDHLRFLTAEIEEREAA